MSDDEELLYGLLGTQFNVETDIDTENRRNKLKRKAIDDEVTDEKGRALRFHGAFTGGFHAGYFNTVGSKEGFVPQQYVSQGRKGAKAIRLYKPEDFMDEEDFSEHGIAPKLLKTKAVFDDEDIRKHFKQTLGTNSIMGDNDILKDILVPKRLTVGMMLLRQLGYVASRGIGDKEVLDECDVEDTNTNTKITDKFDYEAEEIYQLIGQSNKFGLGYSGIRHKFENMRNDKAEVNFGHRGKRGIKGTAFGVGVDEEEEDLEDIFGGDPMGKYNYEIVDDEDGEANFGWTAPKRIAKAITQPGSIIGFQLGKKLSTAARVIYEPPKPSRFYVPIFPVRQEKENVCVGISERPKLMPCEEKSSVFNLLNSQDKERLLNLGRESQSKRVRSRWGDAPESCFKPEQVDIERKNQEKSVEYFKPPEDSFKSKKATRKSWSLTSNLGIMFKSAGSSSETQDIDYCLATTTNTENAGAIESSTKSMAASQDNYGFMTRSIVNWHPDKLLCKRFNVADPYPGFNFCGVPDELDREYAPPVPAITEKDSVSNTHTAKQQLPSAPLEPLSEPVSVETRVPDQSSTLEDQSIHSPVIEVKTTILDVSQKPEINFFKSVFADSDAEFSSSDDEIEPKPEEKIAVQLEQPPMSIVSSLEQALNAMIGGNGQPSQPLPQATKQPTLPSNMYGPAIPPGFVPNSVAVDSIHSVVNSIISKNIPERERQSSDDLYEYKEKSKIHKSKKSKKEKKSKKSKNKKSKK